MPDAWLPLHSVKYFLSTHSECGTLQREQSWENSRSSPWSTASHVSDSKGPSLGSEPELFVLFTGPGPPGWSRSVGSILAQIWVGSLLPFLQTPARMAACQEGFFHHLCNPALTSYHSGFPVVLWFFFLVWLMSIGILGMCALEHWPPAKNVMPWRRGLQTGSLLYLCPSRRVPVT